ncbi:Sodium- and chloride-dependent glycine transporter 2 [Bulinus truncatus]|nr:Sodium- and chloride-dependent glycine transporter 2 [Bulinus truncatus]
MALKGGSQSLGVQRDPDQANEKDRRGKGEDDFYHSYDDIDSDYDKSSGRNYDRRWSPPDKANDERRSPPSRRRSSPDSDYDRRRSSPGRRRSPPDRDYDMRRSSPYRDYDRRRSSPDRRKSPPDRDYDRRRSSPGRRRSPPDRDYDRRRSSPDRRRSPPERDYDRRRSPPDRDYDRRRLPPDRDYDRRRSPPGRDYDRRSSPDRRRSPPDRDYDRRPSPDRRRSPPVRESDRKPTPPPDSSDIDSKNSSENDSYQDPWDTTPSKASDILKNNVPQLPPVPRIKSYEEPVDSLPRAVHPSLQSTKCNTYESYAPNFQGFDYPKSKSQPREKALNTQDKNVTPDNDGYVTLEFGSSNDRPLSKIKSSFSSLISVLTPKDSNDKTKLIYGEDENQERGNWTGKFDFILSLLGYAVGLGNIWRFPYLCYRNGGGAFLFPYLLMMFMIGLPLFYLEAALGQFTSCGATTCWQFAPLFKGLGIAMVISSTLTAIYYNMILGWALHYMFSSFTSSLPFLSCENPWNTEDCKLKLPIMTCDGDGQSNNGLCVDSNSKEIGIWNKTLFMESTGRKLMSPSQEYWESSSSACAMPHMICPKHGSPHLTIDHSGLIVR